MEPFLFKKYDEVIGVAHDLEGLKKEMERLKAENPQAVEYHLREGHIAAWLTYIGRGALAEKLRGVTDIDRALALIGEELEGGVGGAGGQGAQKVGGVGVVGGQPEAGGGGVGGVKASRSMRRKKRRGRGKG